MPELIDQEEGSSGLNLTTKKCWVESDEQISRPRPLLGPGVWRKINDVNIEGWRNALGYRPDSGNDQRMSKTSAFFLGPGHIKCLPQDDVSQVAVHNWFLKNLADADFK